MPTLTKLVTMSLAFISGDYPAHVSMATTCTMQQSIDHINFLTNQKLDYRIIPIQITIDDCNTNYQTTYFSNYLTTSPLNIISKEWTPIK